MRTIDEFLAHLISQMSNVEKHTLMTKILLEKSGVPQQR